MFELYIYYIYIFDKKFNILIILFEIFNTSI